MAKRISSPDLIDQGESDSALTRAGILAALRSLERNGLITSSLREDGQVVWKVTEWGKQTRAKDGSVGAGSAEDVVH